MHRTKRQLSLLACTVAAIGITGATWHAVPSGEPKSVIEYRQQYENKMKKLDSLYSEERELGETFELTGYDTDLPENEEYEYTYLSGGYLGWYGTLSLRFSNPRLYPTPKEAGIEDESLMDSFEEFPDNTKFFTIDVDIENIDASALNQGGESERPPTWINPHFYLKPDDTTVEAFCVWNNSTPQEADETAGLYFDVPVGQRSTVRFGYLVLWPYNKKARNELKSTLYMTYQGQGHCSIDLGTIKEV